MSKKKSSGIKYTSEEEAYNDLPRLMEAWKKNGKGMLFDRGSYLKTLKKEWRSYRILKIVFSNPDVFNILKEGQYIDWDLIPEENIIKLVYFVPKLLKPKDVFNPNYKNNFPDNKATLPILIAYELGKRRQEKISAKLFSGSGERIGYPELFLKKDFRLIQNIADNVTRKFGLDKSKYFFETKAEENDFLESLIAAIREEVELAKSNDDKNSFTLKDLARADIGRQIGMSLIEMVGDELEHSKPLEQNLTEGEKEI